MWTPEQFAADFKKRWEGGLSLDRDDRGNWVGQKLIGSKYGVTAAALARFRNVPVSSITAKQMADLTLDEAGRIALSLYYYGTGIDKLPWGPVAAAVFDFAYNAGVKRAALTIQEVVGAYADGIIGSKSVAAFDKALGRHGEAKLADVFADARIQFYTEIAPEGSKNRRFLNGWKNRANYFRPNNSEGWWARFRG